ncbi:HBL/NHE enterotoxin family protein [Clostridium sp. BNL1100]|uniref:alpha-pore-forming cytotoxin MakA n=1 Tax=Clostridium sp. BNL1100 TaxID=755731 RepID=UPI00024A7AE7|nr:HBL/NHE enterotoxin family protein [Clostridium sp. BNL1100]AEY67471.1 hemolytic enterotoxin (HBL) [Clostridium sp. BNL1100]
MTVSNETNLTDRQQKTQSSFLAINLITAQCHAILNTQFTPPEHKPTWFDDLKSKLDDAKVVAKEWIDDIAPEVSASIPAQVIDYGATFNACVDTIHDLYSKNPTASGADDPTVLEAKTIMQALAAEVDTRHKNIESMEDKLKQWGDKMQVAHDNLQSGASNIQKTIIDLETDIKKMNTSIQANEAAIEELNKQLVYAEVAVAVGIFMLVAGVALTVATAGTAAVVSGGIAVLGAAAIIGGAVTWGVLQNKIDNDYSAIADEQKEKSDDHQQIVALQGLSSASTATISAIQMSTSTLSDFKTTWKLFGDELQAVIDKLNNGAAMSSIIMEKVMTDAAKNEWDDAVELAKELASAKVTVEVNSLPMNSAA